MEKTLADLEELNDQLIRVSKKRIKALAFQYFEKYDHEIENMNKTLLARELGIGRKTVYNWLEDYRAQKNAAE